jgi:hypothetical protein
MGELDIIFVEPQGSIPACPTGPGLTADQPAAGLCHESGREFQVRFSISAYLFIPPFIPRFRPSFVSFVEQEEDDD